MAEKQRYNIYITGSGNGITRKAGTCKLGKPPRRGDVLRVAVGQKRYIDVRVVKVEGDRINTQQVLGIAAFFASLESFGYAVLECRRAGLRLKDEVRSAAGYFSTACQHGVKPADCRRIDGLTRVLRKRLEAS